LYNNKHHSPTKQNEFVSVENTPTSFEFSKEQRVVMVSLLSPFSLQPFSFFVKRDDGEFRVFGGDGSVSPRLSATSFLVVPQVWISNFEFI
jgi:hypothetical protein